MSDDQTPGIEASDVRGHLSTHRTNDALVVLRQNSNRGQRALSERSARMMDGFSQNVRDCHVEHEVDFNKKTVIDSEDDTDQGTVEEDIFTLPEGISFDDITEGDYSEESGNAMSEQIHTMGPGAIGILKAWSNASEIERAVVKRKLRLVSMDTMEREVSHAFAMAMRDAAGVDHQALSDRKSSEIVQLREKVAALEKDKTELEFSLSQAQEVSAGRAMASQRIQDSGAQKTAPSPETAVPSETVTPPETAAPTAGDDAEDENVGVDDTPEVSDAQLDAEFGIDDDDVDDVVEEGPKEEDLPEADEQDDVLDQVPDEEPEGADEPDIPDENSIDDDD